MRVKLGGYAKAYLFLIGSIFVLSLVANSSWPGSIKESLNFSTINESNNNLELTSDSSSLALESDLQTTAKAEYAVVESDLKQLGFELDELANDEILVTGYQGKIARRCPTGSSGSLDVQGMVIEADVNYLKCPNGLSPIYDSYRPLGYKCYVLYNTNHKRKLAILAHELGHCLHYRFGRNQQFDQDYQSSVRPELSSNSAVKFNEVVADDYMICRHQLDTNWGRQSYYSKYSLNSLDEQQCQRANDLFDRYLN